MSPLLKVFNLQWTADWRFQPSMGAPLKKFSFNEGAIEKSLNLHSGFISKFNLQWTLNWKFNLQQLIYWRLNFQSKSYWIFIEFSSIFLNFYWKFNASIDRLLKSSTLQQKLYWIFNSSMDRRLKRWRFQLVVHWRNFQPSMGGSDLTVRPTFFLQKNVGKNVVLETTHCLTAGTVQRRLLMII